ncbi:MAG: type II toxin-antitoxin system VapC family toxin [Deltaproteobacteria bacterium]|nr:type II toxin-antitoxin system VapC family toxin [Deltaproteobacteria bacterium]
MAAFASRRVFLDANVFLYAAGVDSTVATACRALLAAVRDGQLDATTSTEVVQEILHVVARRRGATIAADAADAVLALVPEPIAVTPTVIRSTVAVVRASPTLSIRDAVHVAAMRSEGIGIVVSADKYFDAVDVERVDPYDSEAVQALLRRL